MKSAYIAVPAATEQAPALPEVKIIQEPPKPAPEPAPVQEAAPKRKKKPAPVVEADPAPAPKPKLVQQAQPEPVALPPAAPTIVAAPVGPPPGSTAVKMSPLSGSEVPHWPLRTAMLQVSHCSRSSPAAREKVTLPGKTNKPIAM